MKTIFSISRPVLIAIAGLSVSSMTVAPLWAEPGHHDRWDVGLGVSIGAVLPHGFVEVRVGHEPYYFAHGRYYRHSRHGYYVVRAPRGAIIRYLPRDRVRVVIGGAIYYRYYGVYYREVPGGFCVVDTPTAVETPAPAPEVYHSVWLGDMEYLFKDGQFFRRLPEGLVWQEPPYGAISKTLPSGATKVWYKDNEYFDCNGAFFRNSPDGYKVVPSPWGVANPSPPPPAPSVK